MHFRLLRGHAGFTLLELILVMALIGILAVVTTLGLIFYVPNLRLKSAAQDIAIQIQKARVEAVRTGRNCHVEFDRVVGAERVSPLIWLDSNRNGSLDAGEELFRMTVEAVADPGAPGNWSFSDYRSIYFDKTLAANGVNIPGNDFVINNRGSINDAGTVRLINSRGRTKELLVTLGGAVRVQ